MKIMLTYGRLHVTLHYQDGITIGSGNLDILLHCHEMVTYFLYFIRLLSYILMKISNTFFNNEPGSRNTYFSLSLRHFNCLGMISLFFEKKITSQGKLPRVSG
jgi:hypothetical protein